MIDLLEPELKEYLLYKSGWKDFTDIQRKAFEPINSGNHVILSASTASGKTEAALIPIINTVIKNKFKGLFAVYVYPLKALINDQAKRMNKLLEPFNLTAEAWHGDISSSKKEKILKNPPNFLLITPESLQGFIETSKKDFFRKVEFVLIDEIHYFYESDRGPQLFYLINRLKKFSTNDFQIIGLSATIQNHNWMSEWFTQNSKKKFVFVRSESSINKRLINIQYLQSTEMIGQYIIDEFYKHKKVLVFIDNKAKLEIYAHNLPEEIPKFVHHGSLSKDIRLNNESQFKFMTSGIIFATSTLELGIDIGDVTSVLFVDFQGSFNSFMQRIGRSGRITKINNATLLCTEFKTYFLAQVYNKLAEENCIEPLNVRKKNYDLFIQQFFYQLYYQTHIKKHLLQKYLEENEFSFKLKYEEIELLLTELEKNKYIECDSDTYILGDFFAKKTGALSLMYFSSMINEGFLFNVYDMHSKKQIGKVDLVGEIKSQLILNSTIYEIQQIVNNNVYVIKVEKRDQGQFRGGGMFRFYSDFFCQKIKEIYFEGNIVFEDKLLHDYSTYVKLEKNEILQENKYGFITFLSFNTNVSIVLLFLQQYPEYKLDDFDVKNFSINIIHKSYSIELENNFKKFLSTRQEIPEKIIPCEIPMKFHAILTSKKFYYLIPEKLKFDYLINNIADLEKAISYFPFRIQENEKTLITELLR